MVTVLGEVVARLVVAGQLVFWSRVLRLCVSCVLPVRGDGLDANIGCIPLGGVWVGSRFCGVLFAGFRPRGSVLLPDVFWGGDTPRVESSWWDFACHAW